MATPSGHLQRALHGLTVGAVNAQRAKERRNREMATTEVDFQYRIEISGTASAGIAFVEVELDFDVEFYYAPAQRDSDLERPHMTFGGEADGQVGITATVVAWKEDEMTGAITGATVAIGVLASVNTDFSGAAHVNFQGWGARREGASEGPP